MSQALVLAPALAPDGCRLAGMHPSRPKELALHYDAVVIEADGSRGLPIKAPAEHEPVYPDSTVLALGFVGLDCLGKPNDPQCVHRPELLRERTGCPLGEPVLAAHVAALAAHPLGLFKACPSSATRILILNKSDLVEAKVAHHVALAARDLCACTVIITGRAKRAYERIEVIA